MRCFALLALVCLLCPLRARGQETGTLHITTPHYGSEIIIDRQPVGLAPIPPQIVPMGFHLVEVHVRRRAPWSALVFVAPGATVKLNVEFPPAPRGARAASPPSSDPDAPTRARGGPAREGQPLRLTASADVRGAWAGAHRDLDLHHRWRLEARALEGADLDAVIQMRVLHDLDALSTRRAPEACALPTGAFDAELPGLTDALDCEGTLFLLDEGHLTWRGLDDRLSLSGGRLIVGAPGGGVQTLDGARGAWSADDAVRRVTLMGGRGVEPPYPGRGPSDAIARGGLGLGWGGGPTSLTLDADYTYAEQHHLDAEAAGQLGPLRWAGESRWVSARASRWGGRGRLRWGPVEISAAARRQRAVESPYTLDGVALGLEGLRPPTGWRLSGGLTSRLASGVGPWRLSAWLTAQRPPEGEAAAVDRPRWTELAGEVRWQGPRRLALTLLGSTRASDPGAPGPTRALGDVHRGRLSARWAVGALALEGHVGVTSLTILGTIPLRGASEDLRRQELLPEGSLALGLALADRLSLRLGISAEAVHPDWLPEGATLTRSWLRLRLN